MNFAAPPSLLSIVARDSAFLTPFFGEVSPASTVKERSFLTINLSLVLLYIQGFMVNFTIFHILW